MRCLLHINYTEKIERMFACVRVEVISMRNSRGGGIGEDGGWCWAASGAFNKADLSMMGK